MILRVFAGDLRRIGHKAASTVAAASILLAVAGESLGVVVIRDGFGDADLNNNGVALEDADVFIGGAAPMGLPDTYVPARLQDANGDGPANAEVASVLDATDTGIRWFQSRGFTGGSNNSAGSGESKPRIRIVDDSAGVMLETQAGPDGLNTTAIDSGYAMSWESKGGGSNAAGFFDQRVSLGTTVGDEVKVSFDFRIWRDAPNANANLDPFEGELRFGLFQDTDNQLGQTNPFAGREADTNNDGFLDPTPAVWGQEGGAFGGIITGDLGAGDDIGTNGDNGWTAGVSIGTSTSATFAGGGRTRIREELQADRILQGSDTHTIASPTNLNEGDPFAAPNFDFFTMDPSRVYNLSLSLVRDTILTAGDTITATLTITDKDTQQSWSLSGTEDLDDATSNGQPIPGTGGVQSESWDYFALRNATSGSSEFDYLIDNFIVEVNGSNAGLPGDFNNDGTVDAADYTTWRDGLGTTFVQDDYDTWVNNFGASLPSAGNASAIPEPTAALLALATTTFGCGRRRRA